MWRQKTTIALALFLLLIVFVAISLCLPLPYGSFGTIDFIQYWRSWNMLSEGGNPYNPALAAAYQQAQTHETTGFAISWNPPWTFVLLAPIASPPFETAAMLWVLIQFTLLGVIAITIPTALERPSPHLVLGATTAILFFPILDALYFGQLGVLLATSVALFLHFQQRGAFFWAGVSLLPLSVKPHLFFLFVVPGIKWLLELPRQQALRFLYGGAGGFATLVAITCVIAPTSLGDWIAALRYYSSAPSVEGLIPFPLWQTTTLATWLRIALPSEHSPLWPLKVVPAVSLTLTAVYFATSRKRIQWKDITPPLLCLSLLTSNYGWAYDQSVLIITQMAIICGALALKRRAQRITVLCLAFGIQIVAIALSDLPQHYFVWVPIALLLLFFVERAMASSQQPRECP